MFTVKISTSILEPDRGGITYTKEAVDKAVCEYMKKISEDGVTLGWFLNGDRTVENATHTVDGIRWKDGEWIADITLKDTQSGKAAQMLLSACELEAVPNIAGFVEDGTVKDMFLRSIDLTIVPEFGSKHDAEEPSIPSLE